MRSRAPVLDDERDVQQRPMLIGRANDPAERRADDFADAVLTTLPEIAAARLPSIGLAEAVTDRGRIRRRRADDHSTRADPLGGARVDATVQREIESTSGGRPLDATLRRSAEAISGKSLSKVRVSTGPTATRLGETIDAEAFASGSHIFIGDGAARPGTIAGNHLLAHEVGHVVHGADQTVRRSLFGKSKSKSKPDSKSKSKSGPAEAPAKKALTGNQIADQFTAHTKNLETRKDPRFSIERIEQFADHAEALMKRLPAAPLSWPTVAAGLANAARKASEGVPGTEKEPVYGPLRRRLRIVSEEAQLLVDRANVEKSNQAAGEQYMADLRQASAPVKPDPNAPQDAGSNPRAMKAMEGRSKKFFNDNTAMSADRDRIEAERKRLRLTPAEQAGISLFTGEDYKYINPATANSKDWMRKQLPDNAKIKLGKIGDKDERAKAEEAEMKPRREEGAMHTAFAVQGMSKMPAWKGDTYRGEVFTREELLKQFLVTPRGIVPRKQTVVRTTLSSTSKKLSKAEEFGAGNVKPNGYIIIWKYKLDNGRDINALSMNEGEDEVATMPGATFKVTAVNPYTGSGIKNGGDIDLRRVFVVECNQVF